MPSSRRRGHGRTTSVAFESSKSQEKARAAESVSRTRTVSTGLPDSILDVDEQHTRGRSRKPPALTYASLPSTPTLASPTFLPSPPPEEHHVSAHDSAAPFSLWDYLREELLATDFDSHQELKWDRVSNFLAIPGAIEKLMGFGFILCLDSFLYTFTIMPVRFVLATLRLILNLITFSETPLPPSQKADILRMLLLTASVFILLPLTDASKIYHSIRGQETIKLYVIFNALEIADRLCASIGQDVLDCLFSRSNLVVLSHHQSFSAETLRPVLFFTLALMYNVAHALVMVYQMIALNVAVNSYDHALLTLLVSNQFVEIKGSVFKKFEKDNLFQITCADIVERFTLTMMLSVVAFRNLLELIGSDFDFSGGFALPTSFGGSSSSNVLWTISSPVMTVMASEMLVDWLKHAFITKFNHIRPSVYERYTDVLCRDLASASAIGRRGARKHAYVDQSPLVARRLGFAALPLAVLAILIGRQLSRLLYALGVDSTDFDPTSSSASASPGSEEEDFIRYAKWVALGGLFWLCFLVLKIIIGINLVHYAVRRQADMEVREMEDKVNDFGRDPVGEGPEERLYNKELKILLDDAHNDTDPVAEIGENSPATPTTPSKKSKLTGGGGGDKKKRVPLEDITRFTMVKRIW